MRVRDLMTTVVYSMTPRDDVFAVQNLMDEHNIRHVPIVDEEHEVIGMVTMRDILRARSPRDDELPLEMREARLHDLRAGELMSEEVATVEPDEEIRFAARMMLDNKFGCLPVVQGNRLTGIITESDFVKFLAEV